MGKKNRGRNKKKRKLSEKATSDDVTKSTSGNAAETGSNPLYQKLTTFLDSLSEVERNSFFSETLVSPERRAVLWMQQAELGESLVRQYAWATPDKRAMAILRHFSPIIEIGCGANAYWCRQMAQAGIDVVGYDKDPVGGGRIRKKQDTRDGSTTKQTSNFSVFQGGPEVLADPKNSHRTLFLCYPDEEDDDDNVPSDGDPDEREELLLSMGAKCVQNYSGDTIIHVGELFLDSTLSMEQAPWGRSSSPEFQQFLAADFHCVLHVSLPNWLHTRDSLSVWKRSERCSIVFAGEGDDEEFQYRHVPVKERLPTDRAAPCLLHLLTVSLSGEALPSSTSIVQTSQPNANEGICSAIDDPRRQKKNQTPSTQPKEEGRSDDGQYQCPW